MWKSETWGHGEDQNGYPSGQIENFFWFIKKINPNSCADENFKMFRLRHSPKMTTLKEVYWPEPPKGELGLGVVLGLLNHVVKKVLKNSTKKVSLFTHICDTFATLSPHNIKVLPFYQANVTNWTTKHIFNVWLHIWWEILCFSFWGSHLNSVREAFRLMRISQP